MTDLTQILAHLRHAADCYGEDFPLPCDFSSSRRELDRDAGAVATPRPPGSGSQTAGAAPTAASTSAGSPRAAAQPAASPPATSQAPTATPDETAPGARAPTAGGPAGPAPDLAALALEVAPCVKCKLHERRTNLVFGEGSPNARVMFIGEAPGQIEDETGRPFVGRSGQLLDRIIENAMGMKRADVFIANINKCRPPGNRDPEPDEIAACLPWLRAQIRIIQPEVLVTLGRVAMCNLLGVQESMGRMRGRALEYEGIPVVPTWHPAYLLRNPAAKGQTWEDIKRVNRLLGNPENPARPG